MVEYSQDRERPGGPHLAARADGVARPDLSALPMRIRKKIRVRANGCWEWTAFIKRTSKGGGYGSVSWNGGYRVAHRVVYELLVGPIPAGLEVASCLIPKRSIGAAPAGDAVMR
jgi:hypothetical protein